jgi:hypothetical protein
LSSDIKKIHNVSGYVSYNPVHPNYLEIKRNSFKVATRDECTKEEDILNVKYFLIDIDPIRTPSKISATNVERDLAIARRDAILGDCPSLISSSMFGSSGNGAWILVQISRLNDAETKSYVSRCLGTLAARYSDSVVTIDTNTRNANRGLAIPGTLKCKGEHSFNRPWRLVTVDGGGLANWR